MEGPGSEKCSGIEDPGSGGLEIRDCQCVSVRVCQCVRLSVRVFITVCDCLCVGLSSVSLSVCLPVCVLVCVSVYHCVCPSVRVSLKDYQGSRHAPNLVDCLFI